MGSTLILYQGLQSCMEPQLPQQHVVINKLCPPRLTKAEEVDVHFSELQSQKSNVAGWSSIQHLSNSEKDNVEKLQVYVHPLVKRSSNTLTIKSLEMCTESLGSETGSDISEEHYSFFLSERESSDLPRPSKCREIGKKHNQISNFPPPLTSISRTNGVQVRPHREGGRLILKAVTVSVPMSCFKAERADGRLRLSYTGAEAQDDEYDDNADDGNKRLVSEYGYIKPRKCTENGSRIKGIPSWEPFWVAIS